MQQLPYFFEPGVKIAGSSKWGAIPLKQFPHNTENTILAANG
jgi:hypothetical protein